jgi:hypothetical protein
MINPGDVIREAEFRKRELEREVASRQAGAGDSERAHGIRDTYYRQLVKIGRRMCDQGVALGCTLESHALDRQPSV